jgi:hypothetical protein
MKVCAFSTFTGADLPKVSKLMLIGALSITMMLVVRNGLGLHSSS